MNHHDGPIGQAEILGELPDDEPEAPQDTPQEAPDAPILALLDAHQVVFAEPPPEPITVYSVATSWLSVRRPRGGKQH
jgi:hypothetical protein